MNPADAAKSAALDALSGILGDLSTVFAGVIICWVLIIALKVIIITLRREHPGFMGLRPLEPEYDEDWQYYQAGEDEKGVYYNRRRIYRRSEE